MNKVLKTTTGVVAATAAVLAATVIPAVVTAYGDNSGREGGRQTYTEAEINGDPAQNYAYGTGALDGKTVLNSISDNGNIGTTELNFVHARRYTENDRADAGVWNANEIEAIDGATYMIRLYVHNNNRWGEGDANGDSADVAVAKDVRTAIYIPGDSANEIQVDGKITSSNATPSKYWSYVKFTSARKFHLEYISGSAQLFNNGIGLHGYQLGDNVISEEGALIGYNDIDGKIPGCFKYSSYVSVRVKVVYDEPSVLVEKKVRLNGTEEWQEEINANIGDKVDYLIHYKNLSNLEAKNVFVIDSLPTNMKYIAGTTVLANTFTTANPDRAQREDTITTTGINIGDYNEAGDGWVKFTAEIVDNNLKCGSTPLINWAKVTANNGGNDKVMQDSAIVNVTKYCGGDTPTPTPTELPATGPAAIVGSVIGAGALATTAGYYIASRKQLRK